MSWTQGDDISLALAAALKDQAVFSKCAGWVTDATHRHAAVDVTLPILGSRLRAGDTDLKLTLSSEVGGTRAGERCSGAPVEHGTPLEVGQLPRAYFVVPDARRRVRSGRL